MSNFNRFVAATARPTVTRSPTGVVSANHGSLRTNGGAKAASKAGNGVPAGEGKAARSASNADGSRFAAFAQACEASAAETFRCERVAASTAAPAAHGLRAAAIRREILFGADRASAAAERMPEDAVVMARKLGVIQ